MTSNDMIQYLERELEAKSVEIRDLQQGLQELEEKVAGLIKRQAPHVPDRLELDIQQIAREQINRLKP